MKKLDFNTKELEGLKNTDLKRLADYWLRQYLLRKVERDNKNRIYCPLKKKWYREEQMQASHFIDRNRNCTRYHLDNVHLISAESNLFDSKTLIEGHKSLHHFEYSEYLGEKKCQELLVLSENLCIFTQEDYIELINTFRNE